MKKLCVFCGSAEGNSPAYLEMAQNLGKMMAQNNVALVYGGASIGVMGAIADSVLANGGVVIGVIPKTLVDYEIAHKDLTELHVVEDMHQRKKMMYDRSDAFLSLPGGMGTLDEMFEILTWSQLGLHSKRCFIYNFMGFYDSLLAYLNHSHKEGFIKEPHLHMLEEIKDDTGLLKLVSSL
ncbi:MAG: TIGR00730 family Rossman fold protein [Alphaproteobacteria bacterium]|nr:MAG: TIGR00730 family Rossman fold protein [Alphaproteobacteria bacterium]